MNIKAQIQQAKTELKAVNVKLQRMRGQKSSDDREAGIAALEIEQRQLEAWIDDLTNDMHNDECPSAIDARYVNRPR